MARRDANMEPMVVRNVRRSVAQKGEKRAPARTFWIGKQDYVSMRMGSITADIAEAG